MNLKTIRTLRDKAPFKSFDIHLSDGQVLPVSTPDHLFFFPESDEFLVAFGEGDFRIADSTQVVSAGSGRVRTKAH